MWILISVAACFLRFGHAVLSRLPLAAELLLGSTQARPAKVSALDPLIQRARVLTVLTLGGHVVVAMTVMQTKKTATTANLM